ncbi:putative ribonuclease H-like domain-containing protein [Tanacetum coccineum]
MMKTLAFMASNNSGSDTQGKKNIKERKQNSDDEYVTVQTKRLDTPSFANKQVKTPRENVKNQSTHSQKPKVNNKELGNGFTKRECFVYGSFSHLIIDCDYHVKLAKQVELNKQNMSKGNGKRERKQTWNTVQRVTKQNQFVPLAVQTRTGSNPVNTAKTSGTKYVSTARQKVNKQTVLTSTALKVNTVKPIVNDVRPANVFHKTHSPSSRPFKRITVLRTNSLNQKVYTVKVKEVSTVGGKWDTAVKSSAGCKWRTPGYNNNILSKYNGGSGYELIRDFQSPLCMTQDNPRRTLKNKGIFDSGCSRHMTGTSLPCCDFQDFNGSPLPFNLFSVSQMCDKKNKVLFTDTECLVLSPDFKLPDENQILLKVPRQNNMYSFNLENIIPLGGLACLIAKATTDESNLWHRRLGHVNFKNLNRLVKGNLVRGLPTKLFQNDHTCVACQKGKQHKASCKAKLVSSISHPLQLLHMDLFGPTFVRSINHKTYCLVITDDFSRFSWAFFLRTKDETSAILKDFIRQIENQLNQKGSRGNTAMPELHNKMELLRERTGPLLRQQRPCLQIHFNLNTSENQANLHAGQQESNQYTGTKDKIDAGDSEKEDESAQDCFELPIWHSYSSTNPFASKSDKKIGGPREEEQVFLDDLARHQSQEKEAN